MTTITEQEPTMKAKITTPGDRDVRIERIFNAPRERVWQAITDPKLIAQWWGRGNKLVIEKLELKRLRQREVSCQPLPAPQGEFVSYSDALSWPPR